MLRRPPRATRTAPLFPYTTLFRSDRGVVATRQRRSRQTPPQSPPSEEEWALSSARHVAIIMDGNGRWARQRALPRAVGHQRGVEAVRNLVRNIEPMGIDCLTLYAFSSENWKRPDDEVDDLMNQIGRAHV